MRVMKAGWPRQKGGSPRRLTARASAGGDWKVKVSSLSVAGADQKASGEVSKGGGGSVSATGASVVGAASAAAPARRARRAAMIASLVRPRKAKIRKGSASKR